MGYKYSLLKLIIGSNFIIHFDSTENIFEAQ